MPITSAGSTITVTGTYNVNTFITDIQAIPGVTVSTYGNIAHSTFQIINFKNNSILFDVGSDTTIDMNRMQWIFTGGDVTSRLQVNGKLHLISENVTNGFAYNTNQGQIWFAMTAGSFWNSRTLDTRVGCDALFNGIVFKGEASTWIEDNTTFENCVIEKIGNDGDIQFNIGNGDNTVIRNCDFYADGQSGITFRGGEPLISNVRVFGSRDAFNNESGNYLTILGLPINVGNLVDISQWAGRVTKVLNCVGGTNFLWGGHLENSGSNTGEVAVFQELTVRLLDAESNGIDGAKFYMKDNPLVASDVHTIIDDGLDANIQRIYDKTSNASGDVAKFEVLIGEGVRGVGGLQISTDPEHNWVRPRGINVDGTTSATNTVTDNVYEWSAVSYNHNITFGTLALEGADGSFITSLAGVDSSVTELNSTLVDAYTTIDDVYQFYDYAKKYLVDNYSGETETIVFLVANTLFARDYNVVIDPGASSVFDFDGTTITVRSNEIVGNIDTTGLVTGAEFVDGSVFDSTQDSSMQFTEKYSFKLYDSESDRDNRSNAIETDILKYTFSFATLSSTLTADTVWYWVNVDGTEIPGNKIIMKGTNTFGAGTASAVLSLGNVINDVNNKLNFATRIIYCDITVASNGGGGAAEPFNNLDDAIDKFNEGSYSNISLRTDLLTPATTTKSLDGVKIVGSNPTAHLVLTGNSMNSAELRSLLIQGTQGVTALPTTFVLCSFIGSTTGIVGKLKEVDVFSLTGAAITLSFAGSSSIIGCDITNGNDTIIDLSSGASLGIRSITGNLKMSGMSAGSLTSIDSISGRIELLPTCTGGNLRIYDTIRLIDNSEGTTLDIEDIPTLGQIEATNVLAKTADLITINNGLKNASLMIPHEDDIDNL